LVGGTRIALPANTGGTSLAICNRGKKLLSYSKSDPQKEEPVSKFLRKLWSDDEGQDIAEYAVMLAVILVIVVGTIRLIGTNANTVFSQVGSAIP
jgi:pilus assembly protein Flp/PilA